MSLWQLNIPPSSTLLQLPCLWPRKLCWQQASHVCFLICASGAKGSCDVFLEVTRVWRWQLPAGHHRQPESEASSPRTGRCSKGWSKPPDIPCTHGPWRDTAEKTAECVIIAVIIPSLIQGLNLFQVNSRALQKTLSPLRHLGGKIRSLHLLLSQQKPAFCTSLPTETLTWTSVSCPHFTFLDSILELFFSED